MLYIVVKIKSFHEVRKQPVKSYENIICKYD